MYNLLREKIGDQQARTLTDYVEQCALQCFDKSIDRLATREDLYAVKQDIYTIKEDIYATKLDIATVKQNIVEVKADLLKWMFALFMPFYVGIIAFLIKVFWQ